MKVLQLQSLKVKETKASLMATNKLGRDDRGFNSRACAIKHFMAAIDNAV